MTVIRFHTVLCAVVLFAAGLHAQQERILNTYTDSTQRAPRIARDSAGYALVVWTSSFGLTDPHRTAIMGQWLDASGLSMGPDEPISALTVPPPTGVWRLHGAQSQPALAMTKDGRAVVAWTEFDSTTWGDIRLRIISKTGPVTLVKSVNEYLQNTQSRPAVAVSGGGFVAVAWDSWDQDGSERGVYVRFFDTFGAPVSGEMRVNVHTAYSQARPAVAFVSDTVAVVVWESWTQEGNIPFSVGTGLASGYGIVARQMGISGPVTGEIGVNAVTADYQWQPDVVSFEDGSCFVVWCSWEQDGDDGSIVGRWFDAGLVPVGPEILVNPTIRYYQWLPRVKRRGKDLAVIWSSWQQDGSREGVYGIFLDSTGYRRSFETQLNSRTESFQWEPDAVITPEGKIRAVWSDWGREGKDYEIVMADIEPAIPQGVLSPESGAPAAGRSTSVFTVHILDSTALTGHTYEARVASADGDSARIDVVDITAGQTVVGGFGLNEGEGAYYKTPTFDGMTLEIRPEFDLELIQEERQTNTSGFTASWEIVETSAGVKRLAPIDVAIAFGNPGDSLDIAINVSGQPLITVPFTAWNLTDDSKVELLIVESASENVWDPSDRIVLRTPVPYRTQANNTHGEIRFAAGTAVHHMPVAGDTLFVTTTKPLTTDDVYRFTASGSAVVGVAGGDAYPTSIRLYQNYPNPFNPQTSIGLELPTASKLSLIVYDVTGREVRRLLDRDELPAGYKEVIWDGSNSAGSPVTSGVYFYVLKGAGVQRARRMVLLR